MTNSSSNTAPAVNSPPLKLPTYPARPINGGPLTHALPKSGHWSYEPKYNGWRALIHVPTGTMFNRHGEQLTIAHEFAGAIRILQRLTHGSDVLHWLDCEALERRHNIGRGSLIVLDYIPIPTPGEEPHEPPTYDQRRFLLEVACASFAHIPVHEMLNEPLAHNGAWLTMRYKSAGADELWKILQQCNQQLGCEFFEGLVAKRLDRPYPIQLRNPKEETISWVKHRWKF